MQVIRHSPRLVQLSRFRLVNAWLVVEDDGVTMVDTMLGSVGNGVLAALAELELGPLRGVVLTHAHQDHVDGLDSIAALVPGVEVLVGERERPILAGDMSLREGESQRQLSGGFGTPDTQPTRTIAPGELVGSLAVLATPGHTPGHLSLLDTRDGTLIAGDAMQSAGGLAVIGDTRWLFPLPTIGTWDRRRAAESARNLLAVEPAVARVAPGHGPLVDLEAGQLDRVVARAERKVGIG